MTKKELLKTYPKLCKEIAIDYFLEYLSNAIEKGIYDIWEEYIVSQTKDWEILSFKKKNTGVVYKVTGKSQKGYEFAHNSGIHDEAWMLENFDIHSVKRADGEVFTVGDMVEVKDDRGRSRIKKITIRNSDQESNGEPNLYISAEDGSFGVYIQNITKVEHILTTEDGVDVYNNDTVWRVNERFHPEKVHVKDRHEGNVSHNYKCFSTKEVALEWISENKPTISLADIKEYIENETRTAYKIGGNELLNYIQNRPK